jgi:small subunit ribosomal protein S6
LDKNTIFYPNCTGFSRAGVIQNLGSPKGEIMRAYEITAVLSEGSAGLVEETKNNIKEILTKYAVEITGEEDWGQKKLWHSLRGNESGFFTHIKCKAEPKIVAKLEYEFKLNQNILKSLIIKG